MEAEYPSENSELLTTAESGTPKNTAIKPENLAVCSELSFVPLGEGQDGSVTVRSGLLAVGQRLSGHEWRYGGPLPERGLQLNELSTWFHTAECHCVIPLPCQKVTYRSPWLG